MADSSDEQHGTSDEYVDPFCDHCFAKGLNVKVYGYCKDCFQFLCSDCNAFHGKFPLAKGHVILRGSSMPQSQADKPPKYDHCDVHPTLLKDKFCSEHKILICSSCSSNHKKCFVESVGDACKNINPSETDSLYNSIKALQDQARSVMLSVETHIKKAKERKKTMLMDAQALYDTIISKVNKLFQDMQSEVETNYQSQVMVLFQHRARINDEIVRLDTSLTDTAKFRGKPIDTKLFLKIQEHVNDTNQTVDEFRSLNKSLIFVDLSFVPSKTIKEFLSSSVTFGSVSKSESKPGTSAVVTYIVFPFLQSPKLVPTAPPQQSTGQKSKATASLTRPAVPLSQVKATKQGTYMVKMKDDKNNCDINGLAITEDGRRIMVDYSNNKVKLFSQDMKFLSFVSLPTGSWDIAVISNKEAAATSCSTSLVILDISGTRMRIKTTTQLSYIVYGIAKYNDKLVITCPSSVKLIDQTGRVYWTVSDDQQGRPLFKTPEYVISHGGGRSSTVIVTDESNDTLMLLNGDTGEVITRRQLTRKTPRGVTTDSAGNVFGCYWGTHEVSVLTRDLSEEKTILSSLNGLSGPPQAIVYDDTAHQLIISYFNNNRVDCFKLS